MPPHLQRPTPLEARSVQDGHPYLVSQKIDGIRAYWHQGRLWSRQHRPIPNPHIQATVASWGLLEGVDGELFCGSLALTQQRVMSKHGKPPFQFIAFASLTDHFDDLKPQGDFHKVKHHLVTSLKDALVIHDRLTAQGAEGIVIKEDLPYAEAQCWKFKPHYFLL